MKESIFNPDFQNRDLPGRIVAGLERVSETFRILLWDHAKELGVSPIQIQILIFLQYHEETLCNVSYLAQEFNVTKPTVSDAVRVLAKKGLISKIASEADRRAYSISLTAAGAELVRQTEHFAAPLWEIVQQLPEDEQSILHSALHRLIKGLLKSGLLSVQRTCHACWFLRRGGEEGYYCALLEKALKPVDLRLDCPEFEAKDQ